MKSSEGLSSKLVLWWQGFAQGPGLPMVGVAAAGIAFSLYALGVLPEAMAGILFGGAFILFCCGYATRALVSETSTRAGAAVCLLLGAMAFAAACVPVVLTLAPGAPLVHTELSRPGDSVDLPTSAHGALKLLLHGQPAGTGQSAVDVVLDVGEQHPRAHFARTFSTRRVGRRGRAQVADELDDDFVAVDVPDTVDKIVLSDLRGEISGPVQLDVYRERVPLPTLIGIGAVLVLLAGGLAAYSRSRHIAAGLFANALVFGILVSQAANPGFAVRPELGAVFVGAVAGVPAGSILTWLLRAILPGTPR